MARLQASQSDDAGTVRTELLYRAVVISVFTWRRAEPDDKLDDDARMGWWGDSFPDVPNDKVGSRLWLLRRATITPEVIRRAEEYARESLQWMLDDQLVTDIGIVIAREGIYGLQLTVTLQQDPTLVDSFVFDDIWRVIHAI
jgi:phage gp46-like protein